MENKILEYSKKYINNLSDFPEKEYFGTFDYSYCQIYKWHIRHYKIEIIDFKIIPMFFIPYKDENHEGIKKSKFVYCELKKNKYNLFQIETKYTPSTSSMRYDKITSLSKNTSDFLKDLNKIDELLAKKKEHYKKYKEDLIMFYFNI